MNRNDLRESVNDEVTNDNFTETGIQEYEAAAKYYERRWQNKIKFDQGDWWIAIALYLILSSVAFVAL